jgi:hypothetical protein
MIRLLDRELPDHSQIRQQRRSLPMRCYRNDLADQLKNQHCGRQLDKTTMRLDRLGKGMEAVMRVK